MAERSDSKLKLTSNKPEDDKATSTETTAKDDSSHHLLEEDFEAFIDTILEAYTNSNSSSIIIPPNVDRKHEPHPDLIPTLNHLSHRLFKLVSLTTGLPHPHCPDSVLRYHLLTSSQLDDLARHYHQIWPPTPETYRYPKPIVPWIGTVEQNTTDVETKRERIGRFIGLRRNYEGAGEGVVLVKQGTIVGKESRLVGKDVVEDDEGLCDRVRSQMQKEWEEALERAQREGYAGIFRYPKTG